MTPQKKVKSFFGLFERQKSTPIPYSWTILHFSPVTYYKHTAVLYKNPKPCPIQIFTHLNTGTSRRDKKDKMAKRNQRGIFLGGPRFAGRFEKWSISSRVRVQIDRELVRLITMIGLNELYPNIIPPKTLKKFSRTTFRWCVVKKWAFLTF